jgi:hypothetical protein
MFSWPRLRNVVVKTPYTALFFRCRRSAALASISQLSFQSEPARIPAMFDPLSKWVPALITGLIIGFAVVVFSHRRQTAYMAAIPLPYFML